MLTIDTEGCKSERRVCRTRRHAPDQLRYSVRYSPTHPAELVPIAIQVPRAFVCLISAFAHHGLTTRLRIRLKSHSPVPPVATGDGSRRRTKACRKLDVPISGVQARVRVSRASHSYSPDLSNPNSRTSS